MKGLAKTLISLAVSAALIAMVLTLTDARAALSRLVAADPVWLAVTAGLLTAQTLLMAARWRLTAAQLGLSIGWVPAIGEYYLAQIVNMTLPGGVVGDVARAARTRHDAGLTRAAQVIMIERLAGQSAMFVIAMIGFAAALSVPGGIPWPGLAGVLLLAGGIAAALAAIALWLLLRPHRYGPMARFAQAIQTALLRRQIWPRQAVLGLVIAGLNLAAFAAAAQATGTTLGLAAGVTLIPLVLTAMLIPFAVGGWGWREGAAAALFPLIGASAEAGVAAGVAYGLMMLVAGLPGVLWPTLAPMLAPDDSPDNLPDSPSRPSSDTQQNI